MKRSKILLGVTASLLAVVGFASARNHKTSHKVYYTTHIAKGTDPTGVQCTKFAQELVTTNSSHARLTVSGYDADLKTVAGKCNTPVFVGE